MDRIQLEFNSYGYDTTLSFIPKECHCECDVDSDKLVYLSDAAIGSGSTESNG